MPFPQPDPPESPFEKEDDKDGLLSGLNAAQRQAVLHPGGPLLIVAGPGTGKTRTLTCRIARLLRDGAAAPEQVLAVTFTNKAAREMAERLGRMLGKNAPLPRVATFHAFCFDLLTEIESGNDHAIIDDADRRDLVADVIDDARAAGNDIRLPVDAAIDAIVSAKQQILSPEDDLAPVAGGTDPALLSTVYAAYQEQLTLQRLFDYEDLIYRVVVHLESVPERRRILRKRIRWLFIDEYQDLNYAQYRLIRLLKPDGGDICVIGDPDQSIYGFRGADAGFFRRFTDDYPDAAVIRLERNYRSTRTILAAAGQVIGNHTIDSGYRRVFSDIDGLPHIGFLSAETEQGEAVAIGKTIEKMIGGMGFDFHDFGKDRPGGDGERSFSDFAVLYRTRAQGEVLAAVLENAGIPCQRASRDAALGEREVRAPVCLMRILQGCGGYPDLVGLAGAISPELDRRDLSALSGWGRRHRLGLDALLAEAGRDRIEGLDAGVRHRLRHVSELLSGLTLVADAESVADKLRRIVASLAPLLPPATPKTEEGIRYLLHFAAGCGSDVSLFLKRIALETDPDFIDGPRSEKVALLTLHAAKGLEFPVVFIAGCEDGLIPYFRPGRDADSAEERRLFYVGITRAEEELYLCRARRRKLFDKTDSPAPSPFLADIDRMLRRDVGDRDFRAKPVQLTLFS